MSTTVVVIGAGPCGLSTAAHLKARGLHVRVLGSSMASWAESMPVGMLLKSPPSASVLSAPKPGVTLDANARQTGEPRLTGHDPVPVETFVRYGRWFAEQLVPEVENVRVLGVDRQADGFHLKLASGEELQAQAVVVASGMDGFAHVPEPLTALVPEGLVSRSSHLAHLPASGPYHWSAWPVTAAMHSKPRSRCSRVRPCSSAVAATTRSTAPVLRCSPRWVRISWTCQARSSTVTQPKSRHSPQAHRHGSRTP